MTIAKVESRQAMGTSLRERVRAIDWVCEDADTRYLTHGMHRYSGKFIPQIARHAIEFLTDPGDVVLDLFCGSGTTLLEAYMSGRRSIGIDMNPLATLLARTKCTPITRARLDELIRIMTETVADILSNGGEGTLFSQTGMASLRTSIEEDVRFHGEWYRKWYDEVGLYQLIGIHRAIEAVQDEHLRRVATVAFSDILRRCSHARGGYPNVMYDKRRLIRPIPAPLFLTRLREFCQMIASLAEQRILGYEPEVRDGDARATGLPDNCVDAVITHPPYIGSVPYAEYGMLSLTWLGYDPKQLDRALIGGKRQSQDVLERFRRDYAAVLCESWRVLKPGKHLFVLVGHPLVKGQRINLADMTCELAVRADFKLVANAARAGINRRANKMGEEDLLFFAKQ